MIIRQLMLCMVLCGWAVNPNPLGSAEPAGSRGFLLSSRNPGHGLPDMWVESVAQTRDGFLWFGTRGGLCRYDGFQFRNIPPDHSRGIHTDTIKDILEDAEGNLWMATKRGLLLKRGEEFKLFTMADGLPGNETTSLAQRNQGEIWIGTSSGIAVCHKGKIRSFPIPFESKFVYSITIGGEGRVLFGHLHGVAELKVQSGEVNSLWRSIDLEDRFRPTYLVRSLVEDENGVIWAATPTGLYRVHDGAARKLDSSSGLTENEVVRISRGSSGELWVLTQNELHYYREGGFTALGLEKKFNRPNLRSFLVDGGNVWVASGYEGILLAKPALLETLSRQDGLPGDYVYTIAPASSGSLWVGTATGLGFWSEGSFRPSPLAELSAGRQFSTVLEHRDGAILVGSSIPRISGLARVQGGYDAFELPTHSESRVLFEDSKGNVWMGSNNSLQYYILSADRSRFERSWVFTEGKIASVSFRGVFRIEGDKAIWEDVPTPILEPLSGYLDSIGASTNEVIRGDLRSYHINALAEGPGGEIWLANSAEVVSVRDGAFTGRNQFPAGVTELFVSSRGELWFASETNVGCFRQGRMFLCGADQGFPSTQVHHIIQDQAADFWFGSDSGVFRVKQPQLDLLFKGELSSVTPFFLDGSDGMPISATSSGGQPGPGLASDGKIWFPTPRGVCIVDPQSVPGTAPQPALYIDRVIAEGTRLFDHLTETRQPGQIVIPASNRRTIQIHFTALHLPAPERLLFRHRLAGLESGWKEGSERSVSFYNLPPGKYRFELECGDKHLPGADATLALAIQVMPFLHERPAFKAAVSLTVMFLIALLVHWRLKGQRALWQLQAEASLARERETSWRKLQSERERIARDMHDEIGARLSHLALLSDAASAGHLPAALPNVNLSSALRQTARNLDEIVWSTKPENDSLDQLANYLAAYAHEFFLPSEVELIIDFPELIPPTPVSAEERMQLFLAVKEALHNVVRHAGASVARLELRFTEEEITLSIRDNGAGFQVQEVAGGGDGLGNMRKRLADLGGRCQISSEPGVGSHICFSVPRSVPA